jgi:predicted aconitase
LTRDAGVSIAGSCTPYLSGWIPTFGEHFVTTESSNVLISNAFFGACGNSDGIEAAIWSAVTGRTPKWGNHIMENRKGTHVFRIECPLVTHTDWDVVGYTVGRKLPPHAIPVITGNFPQGDLSKYKLFCASLATTSGAEMFHIVGMTPEAPTLEVALGGRPVDEIVVTERDYVKSMAYLCDAGSGPVDMVTIGCPHLTLEEIRDIANYIKGKKVQSGMRVFVWADIAIKALADVNGYTQTIEEAGAYLMTSGCPLVMGHGTHEGARGIACDGAKQAHYIRSETTAAVYYGSKYQCVDASVSGKWEE